MWNAITIVRQEKSSYKGLLKQILKLPLVFSLKSQNFLLDSFLYCFLGL